MAKSSAKRTHESNTRILTLHVRIHLFVTLLHCLLRILALPYLFPSTYTSPPIYPHLVRLVLTQAACILLYRFAASSTEPELAANGAVESVAMDLADKRSGGWVVEYGFDVVYVIWFCWGVGAALDAVWWVMWVIPAFTTYKIWSLISPFLFGRGGGPVEEEGKKTGKGAASKRKQPAARR
ncbi:hypothetical protein DFJ73DRAFT_826323 [Zopfochytrium polystomum]|nr:hypothetical protein DFJ73DRAFT_826323 [Zopfochytrium polystomum]